MGRHKDVDVDSTVVL